VRSPAARTWPTAPAPTWKQALDSPWDAVQGGAQAWVRRIQVALVLAFTGLRWEEAVAVPIENADLDGQWITVDRTGSESGGRREVRADLKTRAAERVVAIPDIAVPAVRRLAERHAEGRKRSDGRIYSRLINGERGGCLGYAMRRRYLALAHGYTAAHKDGPVKYTAHELRHVCASLLIASGATDTQGPAQMGHSKPDGAQQD
jgi:integrase